MAYVGDDAVTFVLQECDEYVFALLVMTSNFNSPVFLLYMFAALRYRLYGH
jgi:hypothetical protein